MFYLIFDLYCMSRVDIGLLTNTARKILKQRANYRTPWVVWKSVKNPTIEQGFINRVIQFATPAQL